MGKILKTFPYVITSPYGNRGNSYHGGVDIVGNNGSYNVLDYICAKDAGKVVAVRKDCRGFEAGGSYGNYIIIDHGTGYKTVYAHLAYGSVVPNVGDDVVEGQVIAYMGNTGTSYGGHLHFEVRHNDQRIDPTPYLDAELPKPEPKPEPKPVEELKVGSMVRIKHGAPSYDGIALASFVYDNVYRIDELIGNRAVLDLTGICTPVHTDNLILEGAPAPKAIGLGDIVTVNGAGNASSTGTSRAWTRNYNNQRMKVILIAPGAAYPYACNQYGEGTAGNPAHVTGWFSANSVKK